MKAALAVAEQDRLEHRLGQRGAIDRGERARSRAASRRGCSGRGLPCRCRSRRAAARWRRWRRCGAAKSSGAALAGSPQAGRPAGRTSSAARALPKARSSQPKPSRAGASPSRGGSEGGRGAVIDDQVVAGRRRLSSPAAKMARPWPSRGRRRRRSRTEAGAAQPAGQRRIRGRDLLAQADHSCPRRCRSRIRGMRKQAACQDARFARHSLLRAHRTRVRRQASPTGAASENRR